jgi:hypothetical protein
VTGNYSTKSGASKLTVKGEKAMAVTLVAGYQNGQFQVQTLKGKALGQRVHAE